MGSKQYNWNTRYLLQLKPGNYSYLVFISLGLGKYFVLIIATACAAQVRSLHTLRSYTTLFTRTVSSHSSSEHIWDTEQKL